MLGILKKTFQFSRYSADYQRHFYLRWVTRFVVSLGWCWNSQRSRHAVSSTRPPNSWFRPRCGISARSIVWAFILGLETCRLQLNDERLSSGSPYNWHFFFLPLPSGWMIQKSNYSLLENLINYWCWIKIFFRWVFKLWSYET